MNAITPAEHSAVVGHKNAITPVVGQLPAIVQPVPARQTQIVRAYSPAIAKAMIAVMKEIGTVAKGSENTFQRYKYASWEDINERLSPLLAEKGLLIFQTEKSRGLIEESDKGSTLSIVYDFVIVNTDGESWPPIEWSGYARLRDGKGVTDDKAGAKCHTQAEKYFCIKQFKIRTCDQIDGDADGQGHRHPPLPSPPQNTSPPQPPSAPPPRAPDGRLLPHTIRGATGSTPQEKAAWWATAYIAFQARAASESELVEWDGVNDKSLGELHAKHHDLYRRIEAAVAKRRAELAPQRPKITIATGPQKVATPPEPSHDPDTGEVREGEVLWSDPPQMHDDDPPPPTSARAQAERIKQQ